MTVGPTENTRSEFKQLQKTITNESLIPDAAVMPLNACVLIHLLLVYISLEIFGAFEFVGADLLGGLYIGSALLPLGLFALLLIRLASRNWRTLMPLAIFAGGLAMVYAFVALVPSGHNVSPDVALYHAPKQLMQLIAGDLNLFSSPSPQQILAVSYFDNYNMAIFALFRSHALANALNVLAFTLIAYNSVYLIRKLRRGAMSATLIVLLLVGMPILFGEIFIAKNNILTVYLFTVSCIATLWLVSHGPMRRRELVLFGGFQGVLFALVFLVKASLSVTLIPYVVLVFLYVAKGHWNHRAALVLATLAGGGACFILVLPYAYRESAGLLNAPSSAELFTWLSYWVFIPPRPTCGLYAWPQHFATSVDAVASYFGHPFDANLTSEACTRFSTDRPFWHLGIYTEGVPVLVTVLGVLSLTIAGIRRMRLELSLFLMAFSSLMVQQAFYANSVWNYRLVGLTFYMLALGVALVLGSIDINWLKYSTLAMACVWSVVVVYQNWNYDHGLRESATDVSIFGSIHQAGSVSVELHQGTRLSGYYAMLGLLEQVEFDWDRLKVAYGNEFGGLYQLNEADRSTTPFSHVMYCLPPKDVLETTRMSDKLTNLVDTSQAGCHIVAKNSSG